ncbi:MAG: hypothetical protein HYZ28_29010 [Myxococcales bacterium]|nr:hypothetical protein [Myxococcales bacterium]
MNDFRDRIRPDWASVLLHVLERAREMGPKGILAFDLDSTLFDNRPRQARILREFGEARGIGCLADCRPHHWDSGWDMKAALRSCGLSAEEAERIFPEAKAFWAERFFTSPYCLDDVAVRGAAKFVARAVEAGATVAYVTGRHEEMREGTVEAMRRNGVAVPGGDVHLIMKPTFEMHDDEFKREAHARLKRMGTLLAAFDNEPTHANDYRTKFPEAIVVHLATDHSGRPVELLEGIVSVPHFEVERRGSSVER